MSDFTPSTEDVRENYALAAERPRGAHAAFDRWLASVKADAVREYADALAANESAQDWTRAYEFVDDAREWANDIARGGAA